MNEGRTGIGQGVQGTPSLSPASRGIATAPTPTLRPPGGGTPQAAPGLRPPPAAVPQPPRPAPAAEEPLSLVTEEPPAPGAAAGAPAPTKIHGISSVAGISAHLSQHTYKRATNVNKSGAIRTRTFHCRLSEQGVEYLDQTINDWLEAHPEIEVKFTQSTVGMWDGKLKEPTLIVNVWY